MNHRIKAVLMDVDDILLDWIGAFMKWYNTNKTDTPATITELVLTYPDRRLPSSIVYEFQDTGHFENIPLLPGAKEVVQNLTNRGKLMIGVTGCGRKYATPRTAQLMRDFNGVFEKVYLVDHGHTKQDVFKEAMTTYKLTPECIAYADDMLFNCVDAAKLGMKNIGWQRRDDHKHTELPPEYEKSISLINNLYDFETLIAIADEPNPMLRAYYKDKIASFAR